MHLKFKLKLGSEQYNIETLGSDKDIEDIMMTLSEKVISMVNESASNLTIHEDGEGRCAACVNTALPCHGSHAGSLL